MADLLVCSAAEGEYTEAFLWYVDQSVQAAERFDAEFARSLESIAPAIPKVRRPTLLLFDAALSVSNHLPRAQQSMGRDLGDTHRSGAGLLVG
jgi:plasmid stabilization system protein ParE